MTSISKQIENGIKELNALGELYQQIRKIPKGTPIIIINKGVNFIGEYGGLWKLTSDEPPEIDTEYGIGSFNIPIDWKKGNGRILRYTEINAVPSVSFDMVDPMGSGCDSAPIGRVYARAKILDGLKVNIHLEDYNSSWDAFLKSCEEDSAF